jgi:hypothetical protein
MLPRLDTVKPGLLFTEVKKTPDLKTEFGQRAVVSQG